MTFDLEQIAEEISEVAMVATDHELSVRLHECSQGICAWIAGNGPAPTLALLRQRTQELGELKAWIAANKESPQRKAFVEACEELYEAVPGLPPSGWGERAVRAMSKFLTTHAAMIEAEKVEAERGEGTR